MKNFFKKIIIRILCWESRILLKRRRPKIIAITGSVGKTTSKDAVFAVLSSKFKTRKSDKSFNSDIGLPLTILGCLNAWNNPLGWLENIFHGLALGLFPGDYPEALVLEVGADRPGDIRKIAGWLKPDAVIITKIPEIPAHIEFFENRKELVAEKVSLLEAVRDSGLAVLNSDNWEVEAPSSLKAKIITYGLDETADVAGSNLIFDFGTDGRPRGVSFKVRRAGETAEVSLKGVIGEQMIYPVLSAMAVGSGFGLSLEKSAQNISKYFIAPPGRMRLLEGLKRTIIIDDSYNSSPAAAESALRALSLTKTGQGRRIAVLGDMLELGKHSSSAHSSIGHLASSSVDILMVVGLRSRETAEGALSSGFPESQIFQFDGPKEAGQFLQNFIQEGDVILIKGSQGMRMEKTVEEIMAQPEEKERLLVRQEEEWKKR